METLTSRQERKLKQELGKQRNERLAAAHEELIDVADQHYSTFAGEVPDEGDQAVAVELADFENARARDRRCLDPNRRTLLRPMRRLPR
jgi:hypothetical protein